MDEFDLLSDRFGIHKNFLIGGMSLVGTISLLVIFGAIVISVNLLWEGLVSAAFKFMHLYGTRRNTSIDQTLERRDENLGGMESSSLNGDNGQAKDHVGEVPDVYKEPSESRREDNKRRRSASGGTNRRKRVHSKAGRSANSRRKPTGKRVAVDKAIKQK